MRRRLLTLCSLLGLIIASFLQFRCTGQSEQTSVYLNHHDTVDYVGKQACKNCHVAIYESFIRTGMGRSFGPATRDRSTAQFNHKAVYDKSRDFYYLPFWHLDSLYIREFRLKGRDTIYAQTRKVDYIIGSGQHTHSHIGSSNGYLNQLPVTWYAQEKRWDLAPGFENGRNIRFSRNIEMECMSCHNAMPQLENGTLNKYTKIPDGIDCERCHGPGEAHVNLKLAGIFVDTATQIDYSIVNPRKLSWERQIDVCQRCHLQGNTILKPGKKFEDFRPGMPLNDFMEVFHPVYKGAEDEFIMASHAQRLQQSKCFISSNKKSQETANKASFETLTLTCVSCHNPHVSVRETGKQVFNTACLKCHTQSSCKEETALLTKAQHNCVSCHMPSSGAIDIPHVTVHDHKIGIPVSKSTKQKIKSFAGLYCVNNPGPEALTKATAYINYVEKFEGEKSGLDSAQALLTGVSGEAQLIHVLYLKEDWQRIVSLAQQINISQSKDPWLCYRCGQAYQNTGNILEAEIAYQRAVDLLPKHPDFINKLALIKLIKEDWTGGITLLEKSIAMQPLQTDAWVNLGFAILNTGNTKDAMQAYNKALMLDPDHEQGLLNRAGLFQLQGNTKMAVRDLEHLLEKNPNRKEVQVLLKKIKA